MWWVAVPVPGESLKYWRFPLGVFDAPPPSWAAGYITAQSRPDWQSGNFLPGVMLKGNGGILLQRAYFNPSTLGELLRVVDPGP